MLSYFRQAYTRVVTPGNLQKASNWAPTGAVFGVAGFLGWAMLADWVSVLSKIPYIGGRYKKPEDEQK